MKTQATFVKLESCMFGKAQGLKLTINGDRGEKTQNIMGFGESKDVFTKLKSGMFKPGDALELELTKNDRGYWNVVGITKTGAASVSNSGSPAASSSGTGAVTGGYNPRSFFAQHATGLVASLVTAGFYKKANIDLICNDIVAVSSAIEAYVKHGPSSISSSLKDSMPEVVDPSDDLGEMPSEDNE